MGSSVRAGGDVTEAPPPCEICEMYRMEDSRWILESHINGLHAEIAELRAVFGPLLDEAGWHMVGCACVGCVWFARARAALAPKGGT